MRIDPHDDGDVQMARAAFEHELVDFFGRTREGVKKRVAEATSRMGKAALRKDDEREQITDAALDFEWYGLVYPAETAIYDAAVAGGTRGLHQLSITDNAAIGASQRLARAFAQDRAAELVGMKWVEGELIPNPDARWAISDTTRAKIRSAVSEAFAKETPIAELGDAIADSGVFADSRAKMIAKTEVTRAQSRGTIDVWKETGAVVTAKWVLSSIHHCCDECDANAAAGPVKVGEPYPSGATEPGAHPNCNCALVAVEIRGYAPRAATEEPPAPAPPVDFAATEEGNDSEERARGKRAEEWLRDNVNAPWRERFGEDAEVMEALATYTGSGYDEVNAELRSGEISEETESVVARLDRAFAPIGFRAVVYRGMKPSLVSIPVTQDQAYVSTSLLPEVAKGFGDAIVRILLEADQEVIPADGDSEHPKEVEVILPRDTDIRITGEMLIWLENEWKQVYTGVVVTRQ